MMSSHIISKSIINDHMLVLNGIRADLVLTNYKEYPHSLIHPILSALALVGLYSKPMKPS